MNATRNSHPFGHMREGEHQADGQTVRGLLKFVRLNIRIENLSGA